MNASDIMTREVVWAAPETPVRELARLMNDCRISGMPVLRDGVLIGIVTESDLVDRVKRIHLPTLFTLFDAVIPVHGEHAFEEDLRRMAAATAEEIMSYPVTAVEEETELADVATLLSEKHLSLLPVMRGEKVVGIIGKRDVIKAMVAGGGD
ncbi:MAG: CBS domain-containing protein [Magnetococcales bacterium]|nr:CBS domain-containing protein [Magnetococcales bacterium]